MATLLISRFWTNLFKGNGFGSWICILMSWTLVLITWVAGCQNQWSFLLDPPLIWVKTTFRGLCWITVSSNVIKLYLNDNFFSGTIPLEYGERMPKLTDLYLSRNAINNKWHHSPLLPLAISNNYLSGSEDFQSFGMVYLTSMP